jgi:hypothetical protein
MIVPTQIPPIEPRVSKRCKGLSRTRHWKISHVSLIEFHSLRTMENEVPAPLPEFDYESFFRIKSEIERSKVIASDFCDVDREWVQLGDPESSAK